jgi:hypothetical protein
VIYDRLLSSPGAQTVLLGKRTQTLIYGVLVVELFVLGWKARVCDMFQAKSRLVLETKNLNISRDQAEIF